MKKTVLIAAVASLTVIAAPASALEIPASNSSPMIAGPQFDASVVDRLTSSDTVRLERDKKYKKRGKRNRRSAYDSNGRYNEPRQVRRGDRVWRGRDGRYHCERDNGTTGLIVGAAGGALLGRTVDTDGDRTAGTLLGGALGAVVGREIDRGSARCH